MDRVQWGRAQTREKCVVGKGGVETGLWGPLRKTLQSVIIVLLPRLTISRAQHKCCCPVMPYGLRPN